jgi:hypothetical protein
MLGEISLSTPNVIIISREENDILHHLLTVPYQMPFISGKTIEDGAYEARKFAENKCIENSAKHGNFPHYTLLMRFEGVYFAECWGVKHIYNQYIIYYQGIKRLI